jgi:hypothetical protein
MAAEAHLVGSLNLPNARSVFETVAREAGSVVARIPDGETDARKDWVVAQVAVLDTVESLERVPDDRQSEWLPEAGRVWFRPRDGGTAVTFPRLGYADFARASFSIFSELKEAGVVPADVRFQVSLPTPLAVVSAYIEPRHQAGIEPCFEEAMRREVDLIVEAIPNRELALQWDVAVEFSLIEGVFPTFIPDVEAGAAERLVRLAGWIPEPVALGYHLCYGDAGGAHFKEPQDMSKLVSVANAVLTATERTVQWVHMPVPIERDDDAYFAPLDALRLPVGTRLYLGLLHKEDGLEGATRRIDAARRHIDGFGVATECGMARDAKTPEIPKLLRLHREASGLVQ